MRAAGVSIIVLRFGGRIKGNLDAAIVAAFAKASAGSSG
jgi:hypothetical protein